jgi:hypothetical protein
VNANGRGYRKIVVDPRLESLTRLHVGRRRTDSKIRAGRWVPTAQEKVPILGARRGLPLMIESFNLEEALATPLRGELLLTNGELG